MATDAREEEAIKAVIERLKTSYAATHAPEAVEAAVAEARTAFHGRPVRDFIPILVERKARAMLNEEGRN
ncbi:three-helix bundle dimerization domain-containing protein [Streptomyces sp. NPDC058964]|uniref:three-helix bundle dimerization domain-containing protein n=1 Tax=Streptomyces sp. NPDC058964 TaxID=3346681 RepID=UPI00369AC1AB